MASAGESVEGICDSKTLQYASADCQVACGCCEPCCSDHDQRYCFHTNFKLAAIDWETFYDRESFSFYDGPDIVTLDMTW